MKKEIGMGKLDINEIEVKDEMYPENLGMSMAGCDPVSVSPCEVCANLVPSDPELTNQGLIINVPTTINNVCVGKKISVACILCERVNGLDKVRAVQVLEGTATCPSGRQNFSCANLNVEFNFALKQSNCTSGNRTFKAKIIAHYIDPTNCKCPSTI